MSRGPPKLLKPRKPNNRIGRNLCLSHLNIRSLSKNFDNLQVFLENSIRLCCLSETWLNDDADENFFVLKEYSSPVVKTGEYRYSGVALYIHNSIWFEKVTIETNLNVALVQCFTKGKIGFLVACLYNSPSVSERIFLEDFDIFLSKVLEIKLPCFILVDFNIDLLNYNAVVSQYLTILERRGFSQEIESPTRVTCKSSTLIDHIIHNSDCEVDAKVEQVSISDHFAITVLILVKSSSSEKNKLKSPFFEG